MLTQAIMRKSEKRCSCAPWAPRLQCPAVRAPLVRRSSRHCNALALRSCGALAPPLGSGARAADGRAAAGADRAPRQLRRPGGAPLVANRVNRSGAPPVPPPARSARAAVSAPLVGPSGAAGIWRAWADRTPSTACGQHVGNFHTPVEHAGIAVAMKWAQVRASVNATRSEHPMAPAHVMASAPLLALAQAMAPAHDMASEQPMASAHVMASAQNMTKAHDMASDQPMASPNYLHRRRPWHQHITWHRIGPWHRPMSWHRRKSQQPHMTWHRRKSWHRRKPEASALSVASALAIA